MRASTPAGVVTFMFTDIEGSTQLWEQHPIAMKPVLARHDAILRQAVERRNGIVVKATGDGCHAAFATAADALAAALDAQLALRAEAWQEIQPAAVMVRIGIHSGEAEQRAGDYYGPVVNRAARLMSEGHGGQVLVSAASAELGRDFLPAEARLVDLGEHRLRDLVRPEHIFQLVHPGLPTNFPALKSLDSYPNNLPVQLTSFIGRESEIEAAKRLIAAAHLVTFTGSGGTGKTRLSLQVAAELLPFFANGAWLVELAPLTDGNQALQELAGMFDLHEMAGSRLLNVVSDYLRDKHMLLILDNCEHLIETCARLADHLLRASPGLKILASSREALGIAGEVSYPVPSLSLPDAEEHTLSQISHSEAVRLFVERATAANSRFALTEDNVAAVAQVCRRLDGIPLALELAAARIKLFPPEQIAARLNDRFRLLTGGSRTALPRQQTLRAMIDWSFDLLSKDERSLLLRLSVFSGGWTFEAADAVCADLDVLGLMDQLVNKSLVIMEDLGGQARYHLMETIRQYAREKLIESGEGTALRDRHLDYFLAFSEEAEPELRGDQAFEWFDRLSMEADNFRAAIEWGREERPVDTLLLIGNLVFYWAWIAHENRQVLAWLKDLFTRVEAETIQAPLSRQELRARARGYTTAAFLIMGLGDYQSSMDYLNKAIPLERELNDPYFLAYTLSLSSVQKMTTGDLAAAQTAAEESAALARQLGAAGRRAYLLSLPMLAAIQDRLGNHAEAERLRQEIHHNLDLANHPMFIGVLIGLGIDAHYRGQIEEARFYYQNGLKVAERLKSRLIVAVMESELAHLRRESGDLQQAKAAYSKLIWKWKDLGQFSAVAHQLESFAMIALEEGETKRAARLFGAAEALREDIQINRRGHEQAEYDRAVSALRGKMEADAFAVAWADGRALDMDRAIRLAVDGSA